ncbi:MAG: sodium:proton antiporter [Candidatus Hydrogenedentota bacterium]|nr:MAG: sodium:proton antiporter [Candidatus Hydrogenedentota bacterium]
MFGRPASSTFGKRFRCSSSKTTVVTVVFASALLLLSLPSPSVTASPLRISTTQTTLTLTLQTAAEESSASSEEKNTASQESAPGTETEGEEHLGVILPAWTVLPFAGLLLCIAILPLKAPHWFEKNKNRAIVAAAFGLPVILYLLAFHGEEGLHHILHTGEEYVSFIVLLAALYTISGGIYVTGNILGTPGTNLAFLVVGAVLANFIGTTGAAMVLIRPLLRANSERKHTRHIFIFFIFIVCNCGGLLTPLGDPPLFLGFLRGIDFFWTPKHLIPEWILANGLIMAVFLVMDNHYIKKEARAAVKADVADYVPIGIAGKINFLYLAGVIGAVLASKPLLAAGEKIHFPFLREVVMVVMILLSLKAAPEGPRKANHFTWNAIQEVAILFAGIFAAMIPALAILKARGGELGLTEPWHFFWTTGTLSSFLDNAPTYLTFLSTAQGYLHIPEAAGMMSTAVTAVGRSPAQFLEAISAGAVFMGANSYIGNAPNFMVKSICEESGIKMPSFFGYMAWAAVVLIPIFVLTTFIFFR